jgi:two-component system invasion response regulator UvrY
MNTTANAAPRFLIVDDHAVVRQGLKAILAQAYPGASIGEAQSAMEVWSHLRRHPWNLVILDIHMPGTSGLEILKDFRQEYPYLPVLMLSAHSEDQYAMRVLKAGAAGFLSKGSASEELVKAVEKVLSGGKYISPTLAEKLATQLQRDHGKEPHALLSDREFQVLCLIASGKTPTEIAEELSLSVKTISTFRTRILAKLDMRNSAELTHYALENGLLD